MVLLVFTGCGDEEPVADDTNTNELTREEAARMSGKADGIDLCDFYGWYGDGICDTFCSDPDPDCDTSYDPCDGLACGETCTLCDPADPDCFETAVIKQCQPDGTCAATVPECSDTDPDPDPAYDPCEGLTCGDSCTICDPNDPDCVETAVLKFCQADGTCSATQPQCNAPAECTTDADCVVTGCSGQVCAPEAVFTTCEWREEYACYQQYGDCGCNNGTCGWAQTDDLNSCLGD
jgi:eight-cysteine-cluster-containing protein